MSNNPQDNKGEKSTECKKVDGSILGALIGLARATDGDAPVNDGTYELIVDALSVDYAVLSDNECKIGEIVDRIHEEKYRLVPNCRYCVAHCGRTDDFDVSLLADEEPKIRDLKESIIDKIGKVAVAIKTGTYVGNTQDAFNLIIRALFSIGEPWSADELCEILSETENLKVDIH